MSVSATESAIDVAYWFFGRAEKDGIFICFLLRNSTMPGVMNARFWCRVFSYVTKTASANPT